MADNFPFTPGSGSTGASDDIGGVHYPRVKVVHGADGSATDTSTAAPLPVVQTGTPALPTGAATADNQTAGNTLVGAVTETAPASDTASSGLNGRLQRVAQRLTSLIALLPTALTSGGGLKTGVVDALPAGTNNIGDVDIVTMPNVTLAASTNNIGDVDVLTLPNVTLAASTNTIEVVGDAAHDAAATGNPVLVGGYASAAAPTNVSADGDVVRPWLLRSGAAAVQITAAGALVGGDATNGIDVDVTRSALPTGAATDTLQTAGNTLLGAVTETAPASDTASSGLNGRLQRIAQRLTSMIAQLPASLGQKTAANSLSVVMASDQWPASTGLTTGQNALSTTAESVIASNTARVFAEVKNLDAAITVYIGDDNTVTTANGHALKAGEAFVFEGYTGAVWAIAASGTPNVSYVEW